MKAVSRSNVAGVVAQLVEHRIKLRADAAKLFAMFGGESLEDSFSLCGERNVHFAMVRRVDGAPDVSVFLQPIHQANGAVMRELQAFGQFADCNKIAIGKSFNGEQSLMLLRGQTTAMGALFTEVQELTKEIPKCGKFFVIPLGDRFLLSGHK